MVVLPGMEKQAMEFEKYWLPIVAQVGFGEWIDYKKTYDAYNPDFICASPYQRMFIMWDGISTPCCTDVSRKFKLGDVNESTVKEIWLGEKFQKLRDAHTKGVYRDIDICKDCYVPFSQRDAKL